MRFCEELLGIPVRSIDRLCVNVNNRDGSIEPFQCAKRIRMPRVRG